MFEEHKIEWTDEKVERLWDYYSRTPPYSNAYFAKVHGYELLKHSGLPTSQKISLLDFGCGAGYLWEHVKNISTNWSYMGLDFSPASVEKLNSEATGTPQFLGGVLAKSLPTSLPNSSFDASLLVEVVEHLNDEYLSGTLRELQRVLKSGGQVLITTPNEEHLPDLMKLCPDCGCVFHEWQHVRSWSADSLTAEMKEYGFEPVKIEVVDFGSRFKKLVSSLRNVLGRKDNELKHLVAVYRKT